MARADDVWTDPYPGIRHLERSTDKQKIHVITVDLGRHDLRLRATKSADRGKTVSRFAGAYGCQIAVNGDFFKDGFATEGLAVGGGELWPGSSDGMKWSFIAAGADNRVEIPLATEVGTAVSWMSEVVGGYPVVVDAGAATGSVACATDFCNRNPRTAVGLSRDGRTLFLAVIDGRKTTAVGMSLRELAAFMIEVGAWRALNLDGGGSSALYVAAEGGVQNTPSDGHERTVANHLGVEVGVIPQEGPPDAGPPDAGAPSPPSAPDAGAVELSDEDVASACAVGRRGPASAAWLLLAVLFVVPRGRRRR